MESQMPTAKLSIHKTTDRELELMNRWIMSLSYGKNVLIRVLDEKGRTILVKNILFLYLL